MQAFIDNDAAGKKAANKAIDDKVLTERDVNYSLVLGMKEAEIEDLYDKNVYQKAFIEKFGVDPKLKLPRKRTQKWSDSIGELFKKAGKEWNENTKSTVKSWLTEFAVENSSQIVNDPLSGPIDSFIKTVEEKVSIN